MGGIEARDITKAYGRGEKRMSALNGVSFSVNDGEFMSILGPSGCGKTTLLRVIIGLLKPDSGSIFKDGKDITALDPDKRGIGLVFQNYALFDNMSALDNISYALKGRGRNKRDAEATARRMLDMVGLSRFAASFPAALSGGQQQRVAIARSLALEPSVMLLDEPMSALDASVRVSIRAELKRLQRQLGMTMILVTHDQEEAFSLSDRVMVMDGGQIVQIGSPNDICRNPANDFVERSVVGALREKARLLSRFTAL